MKSNTPRPEFRNLRTSAAILLALFTFLSPLSPLFAGEARAQEGKARPVGDGRAAQPADKGDQQGGEGTTKSPGLAAPQVVSASDLKVTLDDGVAVGGSKRPGETLTYTVTIRNTHATDAATNVKFLNDLSANLNLTLVGGSVQTQPIARADAFSVLGNVRIQVPDGVNDLLGNDFDPDTGGSSGLTVTAFGPTAGNEQAAGGSSTSARGGNVTVNADGSFSYNPPSGYDGADSFKYTVTDTTGKTDTATATFTVAGMIWFINNAAAACTSRAAGCGRLTNPFSDLPSFEAANGGTGTNNGDTVDPEAGDNIFIYTGNSPVTTYVGPLTLENTQKLIGQGASDTLATVALGVGNSPPAHSDPLPTTNEPAGTNPTPPTITSAANGVNLAQNNVLRGFNVGSVGNANRKINGAGFGQLTVGKTGAGEADVSLSGTGMALFLQNGTIGANSAFNSVASTGSTAQGLLLTQITAGTLNFAGVTIAGATGNGIEVSASQADVSFGNTDVAAGTNGVVLANNSAGTRSFGTLSITGGTGIGFQHADPDGAGAGVGGGAVTVSGAMTVTNPGGNGIDISNSNANLSFAATTVSKNNAGNGVNLASNAGRTIGFTSLASTTTTGIALLANNSGTVNTGGGSLSQNGAGGAAASLTGTALGMTFASVSANQGVNGIAFNGGTGTFTAGTTSLQNSTAIGLVMLNSGVAASFGNTLVLSSGNDAVELTSNSGAITFADLDLLPDAGFRAFEATGNTGLITSTSGDIIASGGTTLFINGPAGRTPLAMTLNNIDSTDTTAGQQGVFLNLVSGNLTVNDASTPTTITNPNGNGIEVSNTGAGTINFGNTTVSGSGNGSNNEIGTSVRLSNNAGAVTFGSLTLTPDASERGLYATDTDATAAGLITVGSGTITASNNLAVEITGQATGNRTPLNIQLTQLNANGGPRGLLLNNTSSSGSPGGFRVLGTGTTDGSGGVIQNTDIRGADIQNAQSILLRNMNFTNANDATDGGAAGVCDDLVITGCNSAIYLNGVTTLATFDNLNLTGTMVENGVTAIAVQNFKFDNSVIDSPGNEVQESGIEAQSLSGTATVNNTEIRFPETNALDIVNFDTTLNLTVSGSTFRDTQTSGLPSCPTAPCNGQGGIQFRSFSTAAGAPTATINLLNNSFPRIRTQAIQAIAEDDTIVNIDIVGNSIDSGANIGSGIDLNSNDTGQMNFNVLNNPTILTRQGSPINITAFGPGSKAEGRVNDNGSAVTPVTTRGTGATGVPIRFLAQEGSDIIAEARRNFVAEDATSTENNLIGVISRLAGNSRVDITLDDNTIVLNNGTPLADIDLTSGSSVANENTVICANLVSNNAQGTGASRALRVRVSDLDATSNPLVFLEGFTTDTATTWINKGNTPALAAEVTVSLSAGAVAPSAPPGGTCQVVDILTDFTTAGTVTGEVEQAAARSEAQQPLTIPGVMITQQPAAPQPQVGGQAGVPAAAAQPAPAPAEQQAAAQPKAASEKSAAAEGSKAGDEKAKKDGTKGGVATPRAGMFEVTIGTLPAGDEVTITFQATIAPTLSPASANSVSNQGTLTADGGISKLSDDPQTTPPVAGDGNDATVTPIDKFEPAIDVASSDDTTNQGDSVTFTATLGLGTAPGVPAPTGTVDFVDQTDANPANWEVLCNDVAISGATAQCVTTAVDGGTRTIAAVYSGDGRYDPATDTVTQTVAACLTSPVVTSTADDGSAGTLRHSITNACVGATITFDITGAGPHTITLVGTNGELLIDKNLTITGPTGESVAVSGGTIRAFHVTAGTVSISNLTVSDSDPTAVSGGGLLVENAAANVTLSRMAFTGNSAQGGTGGAISVGGGATLTVINTTVSGNAANSGGGIENSLAVLNLVNVTVTNNDANNGNVGTPGAGAGGGVLNNGGTVNVRNSIVTGNLGTSGNENVSGTINSQGNNLLTGDARLGPLASNGGPTQTHALLADSPALDAGSNCVLTAGGCGAGDPAGAVTTDQRGFDRAADAADGDTTDTVDIGAFEAQASVAVFADASIALDSSHTVTDFQIGDADSSLTVTATSDNTTLVPNNPANLAVNSGSSANTRTLVVTPATGQAGTANITVTVTDTVSGTSMSDTFQLTVAALDTATVTITADTPDPSLTGQAVTVTFTVTGASGTPTGNVVITASGGAETCTASVATGQCAITLVAAGSRTLTATYSGDSTYAGGTDTEPHAVHPSVTISDATATEASQLATFTVHLSSASTETVTVNFETADEAAGPGKAVAGQDYTSTSGNVVFQPGQLLKTISVPVNNDGAGEPNETFLVNLTGATNANVTVSPADNQAVGTITENNPAGALLISEVRTSGPGGAGDQFVEIYNNSDSPVTLQATDSSAGYALAASNNGCAADPVVVGIIANGTVIPARGHYLFVGSAYSLASSAAGNLTLSPDLNSDVNVGFFSTSDLRNFSSQTRLDAVGFFDGVNGLGGNCDLLREGTPLNAAQGSTSQYSFFRKLSSGKPQDTGRSVDDFTVVSTTPSVAVGFNATPSLGAPGPENITSPIQRNDKIKASLIDPLQPSGAAPNSVRKFCSPMTPGVEECNPSRSQNGTFSIRRRWTNNTGASVESLRFRLVNVTTGPTPPAGTADLRAISSGQVAGVAVTGGGTVDVEGTTLEAPTQALGGGLNSTLAAGTITLAQPLAPGASINVQFLLGVQQPGAYVFFVNVEAGPPPSGVLMTSRQSATPAKDGVNKGTQGGRQ